MCLFFVFVFIVSDLALVFPVRSHNMYFSEYPKLTYSAESDSALTNTAGSFASIKIVFAGLALLLKEMHTGNKNRFLSELNKPRKTFFIIIFFLLHADYSAWIGFKKNINSNIFAKTILFAKQF